MIFREHLGSHDFGWRELVPRLMIAVVAASTSLWWGSFIIDLADSISRFIAVSLEVTVGDLLMAPLEVFLQAIRVSGVGLGIAIALLYLVYAFFILYVIGQFIIRLALIDLLLVLAPVALGLWVLPMTAGWGRHWLKTFLVTVFQQSVQLVSLALAMAFLAEFASIVDGQPVRDFLWQLLISIAFVYLTTRVPSMLGTTGVFDAWVRTLSHGAMMLMALPRMLHVAGMATGAMSAAGAMKAGAAGSGGGGATSWLPAAAGLAKGAGGGEASTGSTSAGMPPRSMSE